MGKIDRQRFRLKYLRIKRDRLFKQYQILGQRRLRKWRKHGKVANEYYDLKKELEGRGYYQLPRSRT